MRMLSAWVSSLVTESHLPHREYFEDQIRSCTFKKHKVLCKLSTSGHHGMPIFHSEMHIVAF